MLAPRCSVLIVHGDADTVLPATCSEHLHALAGEPKQLAVYPAGHVLDEVADEVHELVVGWVRRTLPAE